MTSKCCPELKVGAIIEFRHMYPDDGVMSPWKQGIIEEIKPNEVVVDVIHNNGLQESLIARKPDLRNAKLLVRSVDHHHEFQHLKGKAHGQSFASTSVVSPDCLRVLSLAGCTTLVMSIGIETNIVGGSARDLYSGWQSKKDLVEDHEIQAYLDHMGAMHGRQIPIEYMMKDYAQQFQCCRSARTSCNQLELMTWLFDAWAPVGKPLPMYHNEVLTNIHPDMILGVLSNGSDRVHIAKVRKDFADQFGRDLKVVSVQDGLFVIE